MQGLAILSNFHDKTTYFLELFHQDFALTVNENDIFYDLIKKN
jgi:hypothetical protein